MSRELDDGDMAKKMMISAVRQFGPAPGSKALLQREKMAAEWSTAHSVYAVYRSSGKTATGESIECSRVGPSCDCFCGHKFEEHNCDFVAGPPSSASAGGSSSFVAAAVVRKRKRSTPCRMCSCSDFRFVPSRPEEVGMWWLPRRKDFCLSKWTVKCRCGHAPFLHDERDLRCRSTGCHCFRFGSDFGCVVCDRHWEEHETVFETEAERRSQRLPVGEEYFPLKELPEDVREQVFEKSSGDSAASPWVPSRHRGRRGRGRGL